jgi:hypothetical protein
MVNRFVFLAGLSIAAGSDAPILTHKVRHLIDEGDDFCPYADATQERLLYNIDIQVHGLDGCGDDDLLKVGTILQKVVEEVEVEIPKYDYEDMQTTICPKPVVEAARRGLRLAESNRELAKAARYLYKGGGRCRRCRRNNSDRRLHQESVSYETTCLDTDKAIYDADLAHLAEVAVVAVGDAISDLKETALECPNLRAGKTLVMWAKEILEECTAAHQESLDAVARATAQCQQANFASSEAEIEPLIQQAAAAFDAAMNAVDKIQQLYSEMKDKLETTDVCNQPIEGLEDISVGGASSMAEMATFLAEMSATAFMKAKEVFSELRERVMACEDSMVGTQLIESARAQLVATRKANKQAVRNAGISRRHAQQAKAATSQEELIQRVQMAKESSELAFPAAERARYSYSLIREELERPICGETPAPSTPVMQEKEGTTLEQWLMILMDKLYDRIPQHIVNVFVESKTCSLEGAIIYIRIEALELRGEENRLITKEDCDNLS